MTLVALTLVVLVLGFGLGFVLGRSSAGPPPDPPGPWLRCPNCGSDSPNFNGWDAPCRHRFHDPARTPDSPLDALEGSDRREAIEGLRSMEVTGGRRRVSPDPPAPEGTVQACPICGAEVRNTCYHDGIDYQSKSMTREEAAKLREDEPMFPEPRMDHDLRDGS